MEQEGEYPFFQAISPLVTATVHEQIFRPRVTVDIAVEQDVPTFQSLPHHHFSRAVLRALLHAWCDPLSIQVKATQRCPIVTHNDTIWVEHRDDLEHEIVPQVLGDLVIRNEELQDTFHDEGRITLTWMYSTCDYNSASNCYFLRSRTKICYDGHFTVILSYSLADNGLSYSVLRFRLT